MVYGDLGFCRAMAMAAPVWRWRWWGFGEWFFSLDRPRIEGSLRLMSRSFALILATSVHRGIGRNGCVAA